MTSSSWYDVNVEGVATFFVFCHAGIFGPLVPVLLAVVCMINLLASNYVRNLQFEFFRF